MSIIYNNKIVAGKYKEQIINEADTINAGVVKIATQEEIDKGENNTSAVTPYYLSTKQDKLVAGDGIAIDENLIECTIYPDEQTIVQNDNGTINCVGQLTKSGTIKFDWEGTEAEYTEAIKNGIIQPDWYCYITDDEAFVDYADVANQSLSNLRPEGEARFTAKANTDLDNLSSVGQGKLDVKADKATTLNGYGITDGLNKNQITNCILEIPQRIKYTLENGTLTLKAGSQVIVPYGTTNENFTRVGNPTIVDGVASGFSQGNYIYTPTISLAQKNWEIVTPTYRFSSTSTSNRALLSSRSIAGFHIYYATSNTITIDIGDGTSWANGLGTNLQTNFTPPLNTDILFKLKFIYGEGYYFYYSLDGVDFELLYKGNTTSFIPDMGINIGINRSSEGAFLTNGYADLKQFSITVDDEVVYRPYIQKGDRFLNDNFKVADTQFADGKFFVWAELQVDGLFGYGATTNSLMLTITTTGNIVGTIFDSISSGNTEPSVTTKRRFWYDTTNNYVKNYAGSSSEFTTVSLPIMVVTGLNEDNKFSLDQVFNGMGYIGSTVWVDKGVKGLIPNGRNEDGSLKNIEFITDKLLTLNVADSNRPDLVIFMQKNNTLLAWGRDGGFVTSYKTKPANPSSVYQRAYIESENTWYHSLEQAVWLSQDNSDYITELFSVATGNNNTVTSLTPKQPFRAVDQQDVIEKTTKKTLTITGMSDNYCQQRLVNGNYGLMFRQDGSNFYILITDSGNQYGTWNSLRPFNFNLDSGKMNPDCVNRVVVETYVSGTSWYRVWSDGWIEQGGRATKPSGTGVVYNLLKKFSNTNYCILGVDVGNTNANIEVAFGSLTVSTFKLFNNGQHNISWYACGY